MSRYIIQLYMSSIVFASLLLGTFLVYVVSAFLSWDIFIFMKLSSFDSVDRFFVLISWSCTCAVVSLWISYNREYDN